MGRYIFLVLQCPNSFKGSSFHLKTNRLFTWNRSSLQLKTIVPFRRTAATSTASMTPTHVHHQSKHGWHLGFTLDSPLFCWLCTYISCCRLRHSVEPSHQLTKAQFRNQCLLRYTKPCCKRISVTSLCGGQLQASSLQEPAPPHPPLQVSSPVSYANFLISSPRQLVCLFPGSPVITCRHLN